jgi:Zn-dependent protease with chaperone function
VSSYLLRAIAVAMSEFALVYLALWIGVASWSLWKCRRADVAGSPQTLFVLLLTPFVASFCLVAGFAIPSFLRFEPMRGDERFGPVMSVLALLSVVLLARGLQGGAQALLGTWRVTRQWNRQSHPVAAVSGVHVRQTSDGPALSVTGLFSPTVYLSASAKDLLTESELTLAIQHEIAHVGRHDNLKKLIMRCCSLLPVPFFEQRWLALLEMDADTQAVSSRHEALDLASALVKVSRIPASSPDLALPFASFADEVLRARVERLLSWKAPTRRSRLLAICAAISLLGGCALLFCFYPTLLLAVHELSEMLVRCA